jgi:hypothetical protein
MEGSSCGEGIHHKMEEGLRLVVGAVGAVGIVGAVGVVFGYPVVEVVLLNVEEVAAAVVAVAVAVAAAVVALLLELGYGYG